VKEVTFYACQKLGDHPVVPLGVKCVQGWGTLMNSVWSRWQIKFMASDVRNTSFVRKCRPRAACAPMRASSRSATVDGQEV
jgi:hypothetical protein